MSTFWGTDHTGTSTKKRDGFNRMIEDALAGKLDIIITKSVSRFARNTVDSLQTIRKLKEAGEEVWFEKEAIQTFDSKGELLLTIMSSLAQEEARSISENVTWSKRRAFEQGKVSLPYKRFLGYEKGEDGRPQIVESEAEVVRQIYTLFSRARRSTISRATSPLRASLLPAAKRYGLSAASAASSIRRNTRARPFCRRNTRLIF